jgi:hypothetical protein
MRRQGLPFLQCSDSRSMTLFTSDIAPDDGEGANRSCIINRTFVDWLRFQEEEKAPNRPRLRLFPCICKRRLFVLPVFVKFDGCSNMSCQSDCVLSG